MNQTTTDWTRYYNDPFPASHLTRRITAHVVTGMLRRAGFRRGASATELGGGNSAFYRPFSREFEVSRYLILDNNPRGVEMVRSRQKHSGREGAAPEAILTDIFSPCRDLPKADLVFSIGLVEHFSAVRTRRAIQIHFELVKPGGLVLISFPCPTFGYRIVRSSAERFGLWRFPDERPLLLRETASVCAEFGEVLETRLNRAILLTQGIILARAPHPAHQKEGNAAPCPPK